MRSQSRRSLRFGWIEEISVRPGFYLFWAMFCLFCDTEFLGIFAAAAAVHELGHMLAVRMAGGKIRKLTLYAAGMCMQVSHRRGYLCDCLISAAGPAVGLAAAAAGLRLGWEQFAGASMLITMLNCLPVFPLDGGCVIAYLLCLSPFGLAGFDAFRLLSLAGAFALVLVGVQLWMMTGSNITLLVIGLSLFLGNLRMRTD